MRFLPPPPSPVPLSFCRKMLLAAVAVTFSLPTAQGADPVVVLSGARVIDGTGAPPKENVDIILHGTKISQVVPAGSVQLPADAKIVDYRGKTILPGLISGHAHVGQGKGTQSGPSYYTQENIVRELQQHQSYGITTVVALGMNQLPFYGIREQIRSGKLSGADLFGADRGIGAQGGAPGARKNAQGEDLVDRPQTPEEAYAVVRAAKGRGTDFIKMWVDDSRGTVPKITREVYTAVIEEAHRQNIRVTAHIFNLADAKGLVEAGIDVIAHGVRDQPVDDEFVKLMKENSVGYIPTLALNDAVFIYADRPQWIDQPFFRHSIPEDLQQQIDDPEWRKKTLDAPATQVARDALRMNQRNLAILYEAGVKIGFGTDSGASPLRIPGFAEHRELFLMAEAGLPAYEILAIATGKTAEMLHLNDRGTIQAGKLADLVVLDADPSEDVTKVQQIHAVWRRGQQVSGSVAEWTR